MFNMWAAAWSPLGRSSPVLRVRSFPELEPTSIVFAMRVVCGTRPQKNGVAEVEEELAKRLYEQGVPHPHNRPIHQVVFGMFGSLLLHLPQLLDFLDLRGGRLRHPETPH